MSKLEKGYRTWRLSLEDEKPILVSPPCEQHTWTPGKNIALESEHTPAHERMENYKKGFYVLKEPEGLVSQMAYPQKGDIPGSLVPHDILCEGEEGFVTKSATISELMSGGEMCDICHREQASALLSYQQSSANTPAIFACPSCTRRIQKVAPKSKKLGGISVNELLDKLADYYQVDVMPLPEVLSAARKQRRL